MRKKEEKEFKRCDVCAQAILRNRFAGHLTTSKHLYKTVDWVNCENCTLVNNSGAKFQNASLTGENFAGAAMEISIRYQNSHQRSQKG